LLKALEERGFATVQEPGRRIVSEELAGQGQALPWVDMKAFALRAVKLANSGGPTITETLGETQAYWKRVFVAPPWEELFAVDVERRHSFEAAVQEYLRIEKALDTLGYIRIELPKVSVKKRAEIVLKECGAP
jgi:predicted ATPase